MADPITTVVVAQAVSVLAHYLQRNISETAKNSAFKLQEWFHHRLSGRAMEALIDLEKSQSEDNVADLRKQLAKLIEDEPVLRAELQEILPNTGDSETVRDVGDAIRTGNENIRAFSSRR